MEYVKMPELLPVEVAKAFASNLDAVKELVVAREVAANGAAVDSVAAPRKVKFILFLNNVVIINENAVAADNSGPKPR